MKPFWFTHFMLPSQDHAQAQAVGEALEHARENVAQLVGCEPFEIVFTGGGTEANNLAIRGIAGQLEPGTILVSQLEHDAVVGAAGSLVAAGWKLAAVPCEAEGRIAPDRFADQLDEDVRIACVQLANPVVGTIQDVREIADLCHHRGVLLHCDASDAFGKVEVAARQLRADTITVSGHKFFGPKGTGALFVRRGLQLTPINFGEPREMGLRPGAENVPGCVGLGAAAALAAKYSSDAPDGLAELRDRLVKGILGAIVPQPICLAETADRLPNTVAVQLPGDAQRLLKSARQLVASTSRSADPPDQMARVLAALGCRDAEVGRTVSFSIGWTTTRDQVDRAAALLAEAWDSIAAT